MTIDTKELRRLTKEFNGIPKVDALALLDEIDELRNHAEDFKYMHASRVMDLYQADQDRIRLVKVLKAVRRFLKSKNESMDEDAAIDDMLEARDQCADIEPEEKT